jgi:hypothetical protein
VPVREAESKEQKVKKQKTKNMTAMYLLGFFSLLSALCFVLGEP